MKCGSVKVTRKVGLIHGGFPTRALYARRVPLVDGFNTLDETTRNTQALITMAESTELELKERFGQAGAEIEPDVLTELQSIMRLHSIDPQELWYKWESYSMKMGADDMKLNIETTRALKQDIQDGLERDNRTKAHALNSNKRGGATPRNVSSNGDVFGM
jgi:hypothetical protein